MILTAMLMNQEPVAMPTAIWWRRFCLVRHFLFCLVLTVALLNLLCSYFRRVPTFILHVCKGSWLVSTGNKSRMRYAWSHANVLAILSWIRTSKRLGKFLVYGGKYLNLENWEFMLYGKISTSHINSQIYIQFSSDIMFIISVSAEVPIMAHMAAAIHHINLRILTVIWIFWSLRWCSDSQKWNLHASLQVTL
jgi:hypothetical protein